MSATLTGANSLLVSAIPWSHFHTLTFRGERVPSIESAVAKGLLWLERVRILQRLPVNEWFYILRPERGEHGGRVHLHALTRIVPRFYGSFIVPPGCLSVGHKLWGQGMTSCRAIEGPDDPAVIYLQPDETDGAESYESGKTERNSLLVLSPAVLTRAGLQKSEGDVRQPEQVGKHTEPAATVIAARSALGLRDRRTKDNGESRSPSDVA